MASFLFRVGDRLRLDGHKLVTVRSRLKWNDQRTYEVETDRGAVMEVVEFRLRRPHPLELLADEAPEV